MGTDSAIFRTLGAKTAMRTDQYNSRWLNGRCPAQSLDECWDSGIARGASPQDVQRVPNMLLACKHPGDYICFCIPGEADLPQMIPPIIIILLYFSRPYFHPRSPHSRQRREKRWQAVFLLPGEVIRDGPDPRDPVPYRTHLPGV